MNQELKAKFQLMALIRQFFTQEGFLDVLTPPVVENPGMEPHIHPFQVGSAKEGKLISKYLHTSPEFHMKELLSHGFKDIFTMSYCFRDEPKSPIHNPQFVMLEWYRTGAHYTKIMEDSEKLIQFSLEGLKSKGIKTLNELSTIKFERATVQELFSDSLKIDILNYLDIDDLRTLIEKDFKDVPLPHKSESLNWDDYYFLLFLNKVEPLLNNYPYLLLYEFPRDLSALSTLKTEDPRVCERFEIYMKGIELCNCFNELTNLEIQKSRFSEQAKLKKRLYHYQLPIPSVLYDALERGYPKSSGIALGVERFLKALTGFENIFWLA